MAPTATASHNGAHGPVATSSFPADVVPSAPEDPLFGLMTALKKDPASRKIDLGIGAYRDNDAKPWILPAIRKADDIIHSNPSVNHEYLPIAGLADFKQAAQKLILGADSPAIAESRVVSLQTISGTGAVHLGALFLSKFYRPDGAAHAPSVYLSTPTWPNHNQIFNTVGIKIQTYPYFDPATKGLDFNGFISALKAAPPRSIILLHACAHNPTGVDPTPEQWSQIADAIAEKRHFPFFDCAYQGFASGDLDRDASAIRYFISRGFETCVAQSFAKNCGLYGERVGAFHFISPPAADATATTRRLSSQLDILQRSEISNPPAYGARLASTVLNDPALFSEWQANLRTMAGRIADMRQALRGHLERLGDGSVRWNHITDQIGMFSFTGLTKAQVRLLRDRDHIYMTDNGRISVAGLNTGNVEYVAEAIARVVKETGGLQ